MSEKASIALQNGLQALNRRDLDSALDWYSKAIELDPGSSAARSGRAVVYGLQGKHLKAMEDFAEAARLDPKNPTIRFDQGVLLSRMRMPVEAIEAFDAAIRLKPDDSHFRAARADQLFETGEHRKAMIEAKIILEKTPDHPLALHVLAASEGSLGYSSAIETWSRLIKVSPNSAVAYANRARAKITCRDNAGGFADLEKALQLDPKSSTVYRIRAYANRQVGDFEQAELDDTTANLLEEGM